MNLALIFLGFFLLVIGGEFIVRASVALSLRFNISKFVIGMTVVSFATSLPELIVSINAALNNSPSIAINNVVGSNIANIGLVLALIALLSNISVNENNVMKISFREKFTFRRGRLNCSLNENGKWKWFGHQFTVQIPK